jgi:aspartate racemase
MIGLIGGLGVGATIHYYRELAAAHGSGPPMDLVMSHASVARTTEYVSKGDRRGLATYLAGFLSQLKSAGATIGVVPAVTPHFCIEELAAIAPMPIVDITTAVADHIRDRNLSRVALFGTRFVIESDMFGRLPGIELIRVRGAELDFVHGAYNQLAQTGVSNAEHRQRFIALAQTLQARDGVQAIVLAGTDFAVMFDENATPFPSVNCARAHINAIMRTRR